MVANGIEVPLGDFTGGVAAQTPPHQRHGEQSRVPLIHVVDADVVLQRIEKPDAGHP
jgi:hypothetical protein